MEDPLSELARVFLPADLATRSGPAQSWCPLLGQLATGGPPSRPPASLAPELKSQPACPAPVASPSANPEWVNFRTRNDCDSLAPVATDRDHLAEEEQAVVATCQRGEHHASSPRRLIRTSRWPGPWQP